MAKQKPKKKIVTKKHLSREHREAKQTRILVIVSIAVGAIILGLVIYGVIDQTIIQPGIAVARVGETKITVREFKPFVQYTRVQMLNQAYQYLSFYQQFGEFGSSFLDTAQSIAIELSQPVVLGRSVLDEMIDNIIIKEEAAKRNITVSDAEIDEAIQAAFGFFPNGTSTPTTTATIQPTATYSETLQAMINTPTPVIEDSESKDLNGESEIDETDRTVVVEEKPGEEEVIDPEGDLADLQDVDQLEISPTLEGTPEATPTITLTPTPYTTAIFGEKIKEFENQFKIYNFKIADLRKIFAAQLLREKLAEAMDFEVETTKSEVWARHILVALEDYELALDILARLREGENFYDLAALYSIDESNKEVGGDLGWFDEFTMVTEFSEAAFSLGEGELSQLVETTFGYHIIQVLGRRENPVSASEMLQQRQQLFSIWLADQHNQRDDIEIHDNWDQFVPITPEVPQQFIEALYQ
ncbi:MAG TPA: peptidylprolyl isomerase [Brevefilum sp.]|nr:peptidylprolyl isomerase [Brevefilum sp.]